MLPSDARLTSPSSSYTINYEIQSPMFEWFDENTDNTKWLRFPATCAFIASSVVTTITRIMGVAESFLFGSADLLSTPFSEEKMENAKLGLHKISVQTASNILRVLFIPVEVCVDGVFGVLMNPKFYIISMLEPMKVNLNHARKGTIGSIEHRQDLSEADGIAYNKLLSYQRVIS